jgi:DNA excision repair protein ERCC-2
MTLNPPHMSIAVRTLVEFALRAGDLESSFGGSGRARDGVRAHQQVRRSRPAGYTAEVPVAGDVEADGFTLSLKGRIDGVFQEAGTTVLEEIKSTSRELSALDPDGAPLHWGQLRVYAALYAATQGADMLDLQLTYVHLASGDTRVVRRQETRAQLEAFLEEVVAGFLAWARGLEDWSRRRDASIQALEFPYADYRRGQRRMAVAVFRAIREGGRLMVQAPTGIGKTMAAVLPAVKAIGAGLSSKIFYLTARTTGRHAAEQAFGALRRAGLAFKTLTLTAKDKVCFEPAAACRPEECPYARGYYDRLPAARLEAFAAPALDQAALAAVARGHGVCPFELSLEMALWVDAVIGDYNYVFDPRVYLRRFFTESGNDYTCLVDEAHNLVDRAREMFSAALRKATLLAARRPLRAELPGVHRALGSVNTWMLQARRRCQEAGGASAEHRAPEDLLPRLRRFIHQAEAWLVLNQPRPWREALVEAYFEVSAFLRIAEGFDASYATCLTTDGQDLQVRLFCIDPAGQLQDALARCRAVVFYSATLTPGDYFIRSFGCGPETPFLELPSPFPRANRCLLVSGRVSTFYRDRAQTAAALAELLGRLVDGQAGNYLFFFPSYAYLDLVHGLFTQRHPEVATLVQSPEMPEAHRDAFLARFTAAPTDTLAGFAVMGGIFGEGIDLVGRRLCGAVIVGVGLPGIDTERELIRAHFDQREGLGFDYAYRYPGLNRVLQAAGRVIRSPTDRGVILLVDPRFRSARYRALLPADWQPAAVGDAAQLAGLLEAFWRPTGAVRVAAGNLPDTRPSDLPPLTAKELIP